ncbi:peroxiredoxin [bacterium]|nr:peroxiredoxin [bacterium]
MGIEMGQPAPPFSLSDQHGHTVSLSQYRGKTVILYFYPKDDTPGCTVQATDFSSLAPQFESKNAVVLGVSKDSVASHEAFCSKYNLGITLLSDPDHTVLEAYGAWQEKTMYGKKSMGIVRSTVVISPDGLVQAHYKKVSPEGHAQTLLDAL